MYNFTKVKFFQEYINDLYQKRKEFATLFGTDLNFVLINPIVVENINGGRGQESELSKPPGL